MFATGKTVGLAEWIIDDTCLVLDVIIMSTIYAGASTNPLDRKKPRRLKGLCANTMEMKYLKEIRSLGILFQSSFELCHHQIWLIAHSLKSNIVLR